MSGPKNEVIGEVECPTKGCTEKCTVFRFRQRGTGPTRFAGKLYAECPVHGRHGADGKQGTQEYILAKAKIWGDASKPAGTEPAPAPNAQQPARTPSPATTAAPVQRPAPTVTAPATPERPWWKTILD